MYASYEYYRDTYRGTLTEEQYTPLAAFAEAYINARTDFLFEREGKPHEGSSLDRRLKTCACALADEKHSISTGTSGIKSSETVGNHSVSYAVGTVKTEDERLSDILDLYLPDVIKAVRWV